MDKFIDTRSNISNRKFSGSPNLLNNFQGAYAHKLSQFAHSCLAS